MSTEIIESLNINDIFVKWIDFSYLKTLVLENIACELKTLWFENLCHKITKDLKELQIFYFRGLELRQSKIVLHKDTMVNYYQTRIPYIIQMLCNLPPKLTSFQITAAQRGVSVNLNSQNSLMVFWCFFCFFVLIFCWDISQKLNIFVFFCGKTETNFEKKQTNKNAK